MAFFLSVAAHSANWIKSRRRRSSLQRIRSPSMNIDAQASTGHIIRVLHLSLAVFHPTASVSNYRSESDLGGWGGGVQHRGAISFITRGVKKPPLKCPGDQVPQRHGSVTVSRRPLIHFGSHVVAMISASKCASCADKHRVRVACPALHSNSAHGMVCSYSTGGNGDRGTHSTSVHLKYNCVHYDLNND